MNQELYLKLKEVNFPFKRFSSPSGLVGITTPEGMPMYEVSGLTPTLSELIEACGNQIPNEDFDFKRFVLWVTEDPDDVGTAIWCAGYYRFGDVNYIDDYPSYVSTGSTPEGAVAELWLLLNKK